MTLSEDIRSRQFYEKSREAVEPTSAEFLVVLYLSILGGVVTASRHWSMWNASRESLISLAMLRRSDDDGRTVIAFRE
jgi:hypothetical protein